LGNKDENLAAKGFGAAFSRLEDLKEGKQHHNYWSYQRLE
jgi:hypothetical protein